ncbi:MAG: hypothetical protein J5680_03395 [Neisseriaceae bacterium]|nr:hypothetical protein [Neisseriaceae bacterium]
MDANSEQLEVSSEQLLCQTCGLTDIFKITLRFFLSGCLKSKIEALSINKSVLPQGKT